MRSANPKCKNSKHISEFRPISLCNVLYKIVPKTLSNELKPFLSSVISINQSSFASKSLITDNVLVVFEIFHTMKEGTVALKLDMSKACDRVEWSFLKRVMYKFGFF